MHIQQPAALYLAPRCCPAALGFSSPLLEIAASTSSRTCLYERPLPVISLPFTDSLISWFPYLIFIASTMSAPRNIAKSPSEPVSIFPSRTAAFTLIDPDAERPARHMYIPAQINTKAHNIEAALVLNRSSMYDSRLGGVIKCYSLLTLARISRGAQTFCSPGFLENCAASPLPTAISYSLVK
jgi:hypothetical protein